MDHVEAQGMIAELEAASEGRDAGSQAAAGLEESLWLCPIEDRRELDSPREGMIPGFSLGSYVGPKGQGRKDMHNNARGFPIVGSGIHA